MNAKEKAFAWLTLIGLFGLSLFDFILYCASPVGYQYVDNWFLLCFVIISSIFVSCAPFGWVKFTPEVFPFMSSPIWRSGFITLIGLICFPFLDEGRAQWYWSFWSSLIVGIFSIFVVVIGIIQLIVDLIQPCKNLKQTGLERWDSSNETNTQLKKSTVDMNSSQTNKQQAKIKRSAQSPGKQDNNDTVFTIKNNNEVQQIKQQDIQNQYQVDIDVE